MFVRLRAWILVGAGALRLIAGPATVVCLSCCPTSAVREATLTSLGCCDEGCGDKILRSETRPCLASVQRHAALSAFGGLPTGTLASIQTSIAGVFPAWSPHPESPPPARRLPLRL